jgi:hypothetical protein
MGNPMENWQIYILVGATLYLISTFMITRLNWKESDEKYSTIGNNIARRRLLHWSFGALCTIAVSMLWILTFPIPHELVGAKPISEPGVVIQILSLLVLAVIIIAHALCAKCLYAAIDHTSEFM